MSTLRTKPGAVIAPLYAGEHVAETSREMYDVDNPYTGDVVGQVELATDADVDSALAAASTALSRFGAGYEWPSHRRYDVLMRVSELVRERRDELARLIMLESAKPIRDAEVEVDRCVFTFAYAAEEARRLNGNTIPMDLAPKGEGRLGVSQRFPIGVVVGITPFNTPLNLVAHKLAPALAAGAPVVIKPALETPLVALALGEIVIEAGAPDGAVAILPASNDVAERLVRDPRVAMVSFTGSTRTGWHLRALEPRKRMTLELGNNSGTIVHEDADVATAAGACATGSFNYAGQSCTSVQRILVHDRVADEFQQRLIARAEAFVLGDPADRGTDIGPMITSAAAERSASRIAEAAQAGVRVLTGGERIGRAVVSPTVLEGAEDALPIVCDEQFAPVVVLQTYTDFHSALARLNASRYGLQAGVYTRDIERVFQAYHALEVGGVMINESAAFRVDHMPYGGVKDSGIGKEGMHYAVQEMTEPRFMVLSHDLSHLASRSVV